jgi:hypothetical protein
MRPAEFLKRPAVRIRAAKEWFFFSRWLTCVLSVPLICVVVFLVNGMKMDDPAVGDAAFVTVGLWFFVCFTRRLLHLIQAVRAGFQHLNHWAKKTVTEGGSP